MTGPLFVLPAKAGTYRAQDDEVVPSLAGIACPAATSAPESCNENGTDSPLVVPHPKNVTPHSDAGPKAGLSWENAPAFEPDHSRMKMTRTAPSSYRTPMRYPWWGSGWGNTRSTTTHNRHGTPPPPSSYRRRNVTPYTDTGRRPIFVTSWGLNKAIMNLRGCLISPTVTLSEVEGSGSEGWGMELGRHQIFGPRNDDKRLQSSPTAAF